MRTVIVLWENTEKRRISIKQFSIFFPPPFFGPSQISFPWRHSGFSSPGKETSSTRQSFKKKKLIKGKKNKRERERAGTARTQNLPTFVPAIFTGNLISLRLSNRDFSTQPLSLSPSLGRNRRRRNGPLRDRQEARPVGTQAPPPQGGGAPPPLRRPVRFLRHRRGIFSSHPPLSFSPPTPSSARLLEFGGRSLARSIYWGSILRSSQGEVCKAVICLEIAANRLLGLSLFWSIFDCGELTGGVDRVLWNSVDCRSYSIGRPRWRWAECRRKRTIDRSFRCRTEWASSGLCASFSLGADFA